MITEQAALIEVAMTRARAHPVSWERLIRKQRETPLGTGVIRTRKRSVEVLMAIAWALYETVKERRPDLVKTSGARGLGVRRRPVSCS